MSDISILTRNSGIFQELLMLFGKLVHSSLVREIEYLKVENSIMRRKLGTIKRECLDHFFIFRERHFRYFVEEYVKYYNTVRPHSSMGNKLLDHEIRIKQEYNL